MSLIDEALKQTTDTKACVIRAGATDREQCIRKK